MEVEAQDDEHTVSVQRMYALPAEEAFTRLRGDDPRPLLILRECNQCKGTDDAFLSRSLDNEKTLLLSRWFHCVKLKHHVLEDDHTFHQLFARKPAPHLMLATARGDYTVPMGGKPAQKELWGAMVHLIDRAYERDPEKAIKAMMKLLAQYDHLDSMEDQYAEQLDMEIERRGPKSSKAKKLRTKLAALEAKKKKLEAQEREILDLGIRPPQPTEKAPAGR